ncbi:type II CRISPR RNA-guided endonuclease Cas9 [Cerasicoccus frondis]|uniref:type II CRISPR RNA-guided endonuclease Cas9 n=1 Tax=Cerasicoccus frondis TaxID=490090 RepID=UPI0028526BF4|nr:type II CRISPR RNA-guided endonuclease Cas9 [Cerasicoccus frondis]
MGNLISFSFDIGHSSIGWAALKSTDTAPQILGCGVVTFSPDDCQNHARAAFRRGRRHIAATRNRMKRLEKLLLHMGVLSQADIELARTKPHPWPWLLAAKVLTGNYQQLSWLELWAVIRWYAHNRGYDGNALWSGVEVEDDKEDTQKVENANRLMEQHQTSTMAETVCAFLGVDPAQNAAPALEGYFKGQDAAFPRDVVRAEVLKILQAHIGKLPQCDDAFIECLCGTEHNAWKRKPCPTIRLPKRFHGGLLFGQMVPRFDNRIIPLCRISGEKTPDKHCRDFYQYRWGMLLCNIRVEDALEGSRKLTASERQAVNAAMEQTGYFTKTSLKQAITEATGAEPSNIDQMFITPEMEKALVLDPVKRELATQKLATIWSTIPEHLQKRFAGQLFKGKACSLKLWLEAIAAQKLDLGDFETAVEESYAAYTKRSKKKARSQEEFCADRIRIDTASGRAPYSRKLMQQAWLAVFDDTVPDPKESGGCLEETPEIVLRQIERSIDEQTNNHLVRHRLLIFRRLLKDMIDQYADGSAENIGQITVEVIRDLQEFSAMTAKEKAQRMGLKLADHRRAVAEIEKELPKYGGKYSISAGLIKKVRIARDMNWTCPFTGKHYCFDDVVTGKVDREHIIPRSLRPSDSLDSLVLTWPEVNRMKGQRTAWEFMASDEHKKVPGTNLQLQTLANYEKHVRAMKPGVDPRKKDNQLFIEDDLRRWRRKLLLQIPHFDKRKKSDGDTGNGFTGRDLTQTSHLNKLAALQARDVLKQVSPNGDVSLRAVTSLSGSVTAAVRKAWKLEGCLAQACPETKDKNKTEVREITHLHHALDAVAIGLAAHFFPKDGRLWELMSRRQIQSDKDQKEFKRLAKQKVTFSERGSWDIVDLPSELKNEISDKLSERRVIQHQPKTMRGLKVQQNTWRVLGQDEKDDQKMIITLASRDENKKRQRSTKTEKKSKLLGLNPQNGKGKLAKLKGSLIVEENYGILLDPEPSMLTYMNVWQNIQEHTQKNGISNPRILRIGDIIHVSSGRFAGTWKVRSIKDDRKQGLVLDLTYPDIIQVKSKGYGIKRQVKVASLLKENLSIAQTSYTG